MERYDIAPLPGMHPEIGLLAACLEDSTREWRGELGEPPQEAITWSPFPGGHSIGNQILHIVLVEKWWIHEAICGHAITDEDRTLLMAKETDVDGVNWPIPYDRPWSWYADLLASTRAKSLELLKSVDDPERLFTREKRNEAMTVRWMLGHTVQHDSYHGAQAVLLHLMWERR